MQIMGISSATLNVQRVNPVSLIKPVKAEVQAAQATTILLAASTESTRTGISTSSFMYMASSSGGITIIEEASFSSSFSATAGDVQSSSSLVAASFIAEASYASAST
ncbi:MAG: hypothetical protein WB424_03515, partial [Terracidiphilus sp.]